MRKIFILLSFIIAFVSCKNNDKKTEVTPILSERSYDKIEQLKWLIGDWTNITPEEQSYENWRQINDSTLSAFSFTTVLKDTVFQENMVVQQSSDNVVLIVSVPNQNDEKPVVFDLLPVENKKFTFVNEQHDFPSKISYSNSVKDSIHAWIEGEVDGTYKKIDFYFKRSN